MFSLSRPNSELVSWRRPLLAPTWLETESNLSRSRLGISRGPQLELRLPTGAQVGLRLSGRLPVGLKLTSGSHVGISGRPKVGGPNVGFRRLRVRVISNLYGEYRLDSTSRKGKPATSIFQGEYNVEGEYEVKGEYNVEGACHVKRKSNAKDHNVEGECKKASTAYSYLIELPGWVCCLYSSKSLSVSRFLKNPRLLEKKLYEEILNTPKTSTAHPLFADNFKPLGREACKNQLLQSIFKIAELAGSLTRRMSDTGYDTELVLRGSKQNKYLEAEKEEARCVRASWSGFIKSLHVSVLALYTSELTSSMQDVALRSFTSWESSSSPARRLLACLTFGISVTVLCTLRRHDRYQSHFLLAGILCSLTIGLVSGASQDMIIFGYLVWGVQLSLLLSGVWHRREAKKVI